MTADNHLEKGPEFQKRYSAGIIFNLERKLKLFGIIFWDQRFWGGAHIHGARRTHLPAPGFSFHGI
jgi:hypothetical protein